ncbi:hypothetical protein NDU88_002478 [Pleurodeles waltl]|uniref:Uncharacterized protein n=1 Tax=Pleurodeles waltl TaxID=8319 RepID=A0AAV7M2B4_PLEWA|nr:hypothetical protein NDU88_002478 [Pleurodeles waltl]
MAGLALAGAPRDLGVQRASDEAAARSPWQPKPSEASPGRREASSSPPAPQTATEASRGFSRRGRGVLLSSRLFYGIPAQGRAFRCPGGTPKSSPRPGGTNRSTLAPYDKKEVSFVPWGHSAEREPRARGYLRNPAAAVISNQALFTALGKLGSLGCGGDLGVPIKRFSQR